MPHSPQAKTVATRRSLEPVRGTTRVLQIKKGHIPDKVEVTAYALAEIAHKRGTSSQPAFDHSLAPNYTPAEKKKKTLDSWRLEEIMASRSSLSLNILLRSM